MALQPLPRVIIRELKIEIENIYLQRNQPHSNSVPHLYVRCLPRNYGYSVCQKLKTTNINIIAYTKLYTLSSRRNGLFLRNSTYLFRKYLLNGRYFLKILQKNCKKACNCRSFGIHGKTLSCLSSNDFRIVENWISVETKCN